MTLSSVWHQFGALYLDVFTVDLLRYVIGAGAVYLIVNIALAVRLARRKIRDKDPAPGQIRRELFASLRTVLIFAASGTVIALGARHGILTIYRDIGDFGWIWFAVSTGLLIVLHDAWFYWSHRLLHHPRLFRRLHRLHHKSHVPTPFTSYSFDVGEAVVNAVYLPLVLLVIPAHPVALLIFVSHMMLRNAIGHCGYELFPARRNGRPVFGWMTTVTHHDLHHRFGGYNLGLYFTWWDRWMGTEHPDYIAEYSRVAHPVTQPGLKGAALALVIGLGWAGQAEAADLRGTYAAPGLGIVVRFAPCAEDPARRCGTLVWMWDAATMAHGRIGEVIVRDLEYDGSMWRGRLKNPENGRVFKGSAQLDGQDRLLLKGCAGPFCASQVWRSTGSILTELGGLS